MVVIVVSFVRRGNEFLCRRENVESITPSSTITPPVVEMATSTREMCQTPRVMVRVGVAEVLVEIPVRLTVWRVPPARGLHLLGVTGVPAISRAELVEECLDAVHVVHVRVSLDIPEDTADPVIVHVADWVHRVLLLLEVPADTPLRLGHRRHQRLDHGLDRLRVADVNHGRVAGVVLDDGAVALLYVEEMNCGHRLCLLQSGFKEEARVSVGRQLYRALGDPNEPCEKQPGAYESGDQ